MNRYTRRTIATFAALALLPLSACSSDDGGEGGAEATGDLELVFTTEEAAGPVGKIEWSLFEEPGTLDPDRLESTSITEINANICESLFRMQPDASLNPWLAESFDQPDPTTFVYHIRSGVTFHNGDTMTADDVVWSLRRHAEGVAAGSFENVRSIEQTGDAEITIELKKPDPSWNMQLAASNVGGVLNKQVVKAAGDDYGTAGSADACTGPFALNAWEAGSSITLERYDDYWNEEQAALAKTVRFTWGSPASVTTSLQTGETDGAYVSNNPELVSALRSQEHLGVFFGPATGAEKLIPTGTRTDPMLRRALALAIDREGIVNAAYQGMAEPWTSPVGPGAWGYARDDFEAASEEIDLPTSPTDDSLAQAKELVAQADVPESPLVIASDGSSLRNVIANEVVRAGESIGLDVEIETVGEAGYDQLFVSDDARKGIDFIGDDWDLNTPDPLGLFDSLVPGSSVNYIDYQNSEYNRLFDEASVTYNDRRRAARTLEIQDIALRDMLWIPLLSAPNPLVMNDRLTGAPVSFAYRNYPWAADIGSAS